MDEVAITPLGSFPAEGMRNGAADICIRYQGIEISPKHDGKPAETAKLGRVLRRRFLGEVELVDVAVEGADDPLHARIRNADLLKPGTEVWVDFEPRDILVFENERS